MSSGVDRRSLTFFSGLDVFVVVVGLCEKISTVIFEHWLPKLPPPSLTLCSRLLIAIAFYCLLKLLASFESLSGGVLLVSVYSLSDSMIISFGLMDARSKKLICMSFSHFDASMCMFCS